MAEQDYRVTLDGVDWRASFPFLKLFSAFGMAVQPWRLLLSLMLVLLLYLGGVAMDFVWQEQVYSNEVGAYVKNDAEGFDAWLEFKQAGDTEATPAKKDKIFSTVVDLQVRSFERMVVSATALDFGIRDFASGRGADSGGVIGALAEMTVRTPGWLYAAHPGFMVIYLLYAFALTSLFGAAICRVAAMDACRREYVSAYEGLRFGLQHWVQVMIAPLLPLAIVVLIRVVLALCGWVFELPVLDVIGAMLFGLMLFGGFVAAAFLIGFVFGVNLLTPAIAVEGTDAFDVMGRAYSYILGRFWRYLAYTAVVIVYGAVTYLMIGLFVFCMIWITKDSLATWLSTSVEEPARLNAMMPDPQWGRLLPDADWDNLGVSGTLAAAILMVWLKLVIAVLPAFAVSYYFNAQTLVYLLLRRSCDMVEFDDVYIEPDPTEDAPARDKVEPARNAEVSE